MIFTTLVLAVVAVVVYFAFLKPAEPKQRVEGCIFITGCDSGMGEISSIQLAKLGFHIFAGVFLPESFEKLKEKARKEIGSDANIEPVRINVKDPASITAAVDTVRKAILARKTANPSDVPTKHGLVGVINCAGVAYAGPFEYMPLTAFSDQMDVNFMGYVRVAQAFLPLLKESTEAKGARKGRMVFVGTGGGVPSPSPALISSYMASKWAGDAFVQSLRLEMKLAKRNIECCLVNPGIVKPTNLMPFGKTLMERVWKDMPPQARTEYGHFMDSFTEFNEKEKGIHPREIANAMEQAMTVGTAPLRYKVGFESKAALVVGLLPTAWRETILTKAMYSLVQPKP